MMVASGRQLIDPDLPEYAHVLKRTNDSVTVSAQSPKQGYLILTDTYYPGWKAYLDGREMIVQPANHAFRSVFFFPGKHTIVFKYEPQSFATGLQLMQVGVLLCLFVLACGVLPVYFRSSSTSRQEELGKQQENSKS
jgi:uncharacterized membrane protein YfhO